MYRTEQIASAELKKLADYLGKNKILHTLECIPYFDADGTLITREVNQIIVYDRFRNNMHGEKKSDSLAGAAPSWDAICYRGTYGYRDGLLEVMGDIVRDEGSVEGWLTADTIIERLNKLREINDSKYDSVNRDL